MEGLGRVSGRGGKGISYFQRNQHFTLISSWRHHYNRPLFWTKDVPFYSRGSEEDLYSDIKIVKAIINDININFEF
jgi:hypothetical protein